MGKRKLTQQELDVVTRLAKDWGKIIVRRGFGEHGPGLEVDLEQMEQLAMAAAQGLIAGTLQEATSQQAQRMGEQHRCPSCGRLCPGTTEQRTVVVRGGSFEHHEPKGQCPACRRDFFPSASAFATGHARLLSAHSAQNPDDSGRGEKL